MAIFKYVGRDAQGSSVKGEVEASSADTATDQVMQKGILPSSISN